MSGLMVPASIVEVKHEHSTEILEVSKVDVSGKESGKSKLGSVAFRIPILELRRIIYLSSCKGRGFGYDSKGEHVGEREGMLKNEKQFSSQ